MNTTSKMTFRLVAIAQIIAITLLAACTSGLSANACHATGDAANPYEEVTVNTTELVNEHLAHPSDIFPVPEGGCPASLVEPSDGKITICHATNSETNPYEEITVSVNGLDGHGKHEGDIIPVPEEGCPASLTVVSQDDLSTVCHATGEAANPYEEITVNSAELNEHREHLNDINPVPAGGCPTSPVVIVGGMITICHATDQDEANPYDEVAVSVDGLDGHGEHEGDIVPVPEGGCPTSQAEPGDGKITICHATRSETNPYNKITVSVNGLNGHDRHEGDIIPATEGGCPTTRP